MTARLPLRLASAAACLAVASCGERKSLPFDPGRGGPDPTATFARVQQEVLTPSCALAGCHAGAGPASGLDLAPGHAYTSTVLVASSERPSLARVAPGDPERSYLIKKVRGDADITGARMPLTGGPLPVSQVQLLTDWVRRGAPLD